MNKRISEQGTSRGYLAKTSQAVYEADICHALLTVLHLASGSPHPGGLICQGRRWTLAFPASLVAREPALEPGTPAGFCSWLQKGWVPTAQLDSVGLVAATPVSHGGVDDVPMVALSASLWDADGTDHSI